MFSRGIRANLYNFSQIHLREKSLIFSIYESGSEIFLNTLFTENSRPINVFYVQNSVAKSIFDLNRSCPWNHDKISSLHSTFADT